MVNLSVNEKKDVCNLCKNSNEIIDMKIGGVVTLHLCQDCLETIYNRVGDFLQYKDNVIVENKFYTIREFSKLLGVSAQTLRNWDKKGWLTPNHTSSGSGYRYYSHDQLLHVKNNGVYEKKYASYKDKK